MDKAIKIDFVANGMLYKDIGNIQLFYYFNLINLVVCHFVLFIEIFINLFYEFNLELFFKDIFFFTNLIIIYYSNSNKFKKSTIKHFDMIFTSQIKIKYVILSILISIISLTLSILIVMQFNFYSNWIMDEFNVIYLNYSLFFMAFYCFRIKLQNLTIFYLKISDLSNVFHDFTIYLKENSLELINLLNQYLEIRRNYNKIIFCFNELFSNLVFFYYIPLIYLISNFKISFLSDIIYISNMIYFVIYIICYSYYLDSIDENVKYLKTLVDKNECVKDNLLRETNLYKIKELDLSNDINIPQKELLLKNYIIDIENAQSIDWLIFSNVLNQNFRSFEIFGLKIENSSLISKIVSLSILIIFGFKRI